MLQRVTDEFATELLSAETAPSPEGGAAAANEAAARLLADVARFVVDATVSAAR